MLRVDQATTIVLEHTRDFDAELVPIELAAGRVLAEPLIADRDFPPFNRVTMDGIAIDYQFYKQGIRHFNIADMQAAGMPPLQLPPQQCLEVMTGAVLPRGADTVIRYEDIRIVDGVAHLETQNIEAGQNIHQQGSDRRQGEILIAPPRIVGPAEIGVAATIGKVALQVKKLPQVAIISTGDEIVDSSATPLPHQIRSSNAYTLHALLGQWGIDAARLHLVDDRQTTIQGLQDALIRYDVLLLSGGVSMGKLDYVPEALSTLGVTKLFYKVQQRPGKPFWFGQAENGATIFALPGNPVSAFLCALIYVQPWLRQCFGLSPMTAQVAVLNEDVVFKPDLTYFLQVQVQTNDAGQMRALPLAGGGSGDLVNLTQADGFLELPLGQDLYKKGSIFKYWSYRH
ncbi:MAG TPA: molybdopterin molybdotransferase MoeA [Saprospiraceae bacterium]|nr:molybdopterin molybdotransferase MoeA [Saprospiraceae bacterium]